MKRTDWKGQPFLYCKEAEAKGDGNKLKKEHTIIIGAGPCGLSAALELKKKGIDALLIEKGNIVDAIYRYPTHQTFFSSSDRLEIGGVPFITAEKKPNRNQAMAYYREVAQREALRIKSYEEVLTVEGEKGSFEVTTQSFNGGKEKYQAQFVIVATGYYGQANPLKLEKESNNKVFHYFKEAHPFFQKKVVVVGGKNSAVDATLELYKAGAEVTVLYRGSDYSKSVKPWVLPEFASLVRNNKITMEFDAVLCEVTEEEVTYMKNGEEKRIKNDFVFAMTGYRPDIGFLTDMGIKVNKDNGEPHYMETTMESNVPGIYIAGVVAAGFNNNSIFIENGRFHGGLIAESISACRINQ